MREVGDVMGIDFALGLLSGRGPIQNCEYRTFLAIRQARPKANNESVDGSGTAASTRKKPSPNICAADTLMVIECDPGKSENAP
jgi:hypothetical protein